MTDDEIKTYFLNRPLPAGHVRYCAWESTDDLSNMVQLALERVARNDDAAATSRQVLERVVTWLEHGQHETQAKKLDH